LNSKQVIEALLLVSKDPLTLDKIQQSTGMDPHIIEADLAELEAEYLNRGVKIYKISGGWQFGTNPETAPYVEKMLNSPVETTLSHQALETLAIVAYRQPVTRLVIEQIRGVNSDSPIESLIAKRMIKEIGRDEAVGRPFLYGTTDEFLKHFGLSSVEELPRDQFNNLSLPPEVILGEVEAPNDHAIFTKEAKEVVPSDFIPPTEQTVDQPSLSRSDLQ
jgi:segregation and condensation protein B